MMNTLLSTGGAGPIAKAHSCLDGISSVQATAAAAHSEIGFLFKREMIQAFLADRKGMTRRIPFLPKGWSWHSISGLPVCPSGVEHDLNGFVWKRAPKVGDCVYAKETHALSHGKVIYQADIDEDEFFESTNRWKPSLLMRKEHSRIRRIISAIRYERLHDISEEDAISEGVEPSGAPVNKLSTERLWTDYLNPGLSEPSARKSFQSLWIRINGEKSWLSNPIVRVISFELPR